MKSEHFFIIISVVGSIVMAITVVFPMIADMIDDYYLNRRNKK